MNKTHLLSQYGTEDAFFVVCKKIRSFVVSRIEWGYNISEEANNKKKVIGKTNALKAIIEDIKTRVSYPISVIISHCHNLPFAEKLRDRIKELWSKATVKIQPTRGLDSYYAEKNGIIVGFWGSKELSAEI